VQVVLDVLAPAVLPVIEVIGIDPGKLWARVGDLDLGLPHFRPVAIPLVIQIEVAQSTDNESHVLRILSQILGQLGMETNEGLLIEVAPPHIRIPFTLHPDKADAGQLLALYSWIYLAHETIVEVSRLGGLFSLRGLPLFPPTVDGLSPEGILYDNDLVLAQGLFDRRGKGFVRPVALHIGLPGKNEQVLGMMLRAGDQAEEMGKKEE